MISLYQGVGEVLTHHHVDVDGAALTRQAAVTLPAGVQYAWPHPSRRYLYVASSNGGPCTASSRTVLSAHKASAMPLVSITCLRLRSFLAFFFNCRRLHGIAGRAHRVVSMLRVLQNRSLVSTV